MFATETFESYNALIRDHSIHSNPQAPSRDIGLGFANANQIRHLTSGGRFILGEILSRKSVLDKKKLTPENLHQKDHELCLEDFQSVGPDVMALVRQDQQLQKYIGFFDASESTKGM